MPSIASARDADVVVIHDAARPLVSHEVIRRTVEAAAATGAAIAAIRARDTVKRADAAGRIAETLNRDEIYLAQTPQAFLVDVLRDALTISDDATDEAALAEQAGHAVQLVEGDPRNLKITTPDDLALAERLLGGSGRPVVAHWQRLRPPSPRRRPAADSRRRDDSLREGAPRSLGRRRRSVTP